MILCWLPKNAGEGNGANPDGCAKCATVEKTRVDRHDTAGM
ncbi:hypothetical protein [Flavobacterium sp. N3904]|nr:hypothetical protein [Flavobacterium sp. N3904]